MRGGAVCHISSISAGVRTQAWLTRSPRVRSSDRVSAARARAGSMVRVETARRTRLCGRAGVAEQAAEDVGEEVREQGGFLELVGATGGNEAGPVLEFGLPVPRLLRQTERPYLLAQDLRVEERFGFDSHLPGGRVCGCREKTKRVEHRTSSHLDHRKAG